MTTTLHPATLVFDDESAARHGLWIVCSGGRLIEPEPIPLDQPLQIGRDPNVAVALVDGRLSKLHCAIHPAGESQHVIRDLDSTNGTFVNAVRRSEARLSPADVIRIGDSLLVYNRIPVAGLPPPPLPLLGASAAMLELGQVLRNVAPTDLSVVVQGETGSGKELVARALHLLSGRRGAIVAVNAAALPQPLFESEAFGHVRGAFTGAVADAKGWFVSAADGTLFLDEIGELSLDLQAKLLRALEQRSVRPVGGTREVKINARIVAATNICLKDAVAAGGFRGDLYARLSELTITVPPLCQRPEDVGPLLQGFVSEYGTREAPPVFDVSFLEALLLYEWPFNVRELRSLVRRLAALYRDADVWEARMLPREMHEPLRNRKVSPEEASNTVVDLPGPSEPELRELLRRFSGNVKEIAKELGKDRKQVYRWLDRNGLSPQMFRGNKPT
jgi:DNA-binding NtrC family response regulator